VREWLACTLLLSCTPPRSTTSVSDSVSASVSASASVSVSDSDSGSAPVSAPEPKKASGDYGIVIVPPESPTPAVFYFHGKWASPEDSCSFFERAVTIGPPSSTLICPRGNLPSSSGGGWGGALTDEKRSLDAAIEAARTLAPDAVLDGGIAMGFSGGAAFAVKLALAEPGRFRGLVLMSMVLKLDATKLKAAGVKRVVLMTGELDGSLASMTANAKMLNAAGLETRFVSLGKVGHHFAVDMETRMIDVVSWVRGEP
jgi:predicted esterase